MPKYVFPSDWITNTYLSFYYTLSTLHLQIQSHVFSSDIYPFVHVLKVKNLYNKQMSKL